MRANKQCRRSDASYMGRINVTSSLSSTGADPTESIALDRLPQPNKRAKGSTASFQWKRAQDVDGVGLGAERGSAPPPTGQLTAHVKSVPRQTGAFSFFSFLH